MNKEAIIIFCCIWLVQSIMLNKAVADCAEQQNTININIAASPGSVRRAEMQLGYYTDSEQQQKGHLWLTQVSSQYVIDELYRWPVQDEIIEQFIMSPQPVDTNNDGINDAIYAINRQGLIWFIPLSASGFGSPELVADLSHPGWHFLQSFQWLSVKAPVGLQQSRLLLEDMRVLLVTAYDQSSGQDVLILLKHRYTAQNKATVRLTDLVNRTSDLLSEDEQMRLYSAAGWVMELPGQISLKPKVYAGVVYFSVIETGTEEKQDCFPLAERAWLYAVSLYDATAIYTHRYQTINSLRQASFQLVPKEDNTLSLYLKTADDQLLVLESLQALSDECISCRTILLVPQGALWQSLAQFVIERGAH